MTACICPVVGSAALTLSVPKVRDAVHKATAPRQYAKPKTRVRTPVAEVAPAAVAPCPTAVPVILSSLDLPVGPTELASFDPPDLLPPFRPTGPTGGPLIPRTIVPPRTIDPPAPLLPDAQTWVQMILGFGLIGGAIRVHQARRRRTMLVASNVSVTFGGFAPESERPFT